VRGAPVVALALALAACGGEARPVADVSRAQAAAVPESLVLRTPAGVEVWTASGRDARDSAGTPCRERLLEIRRDGRRIPVPLLYTGEPPVLLDDSTVRAHVWRDCRPRAAYRVNLRTGQPVPDTGRR